MNKKLMLILALGLFAACFGAQAQDNISLDQLPPLESMTYLNPLKSSQYTFKKGDMFYVQVPIHGSVGYGADYHIKISGIIRLLSTDTKYEHPEKMKKGMSGGDAATLTYVFEALAPGKCELTIDRIFRGKLDESNQYSIEVE